MPDLLDRLRAALADRYTIERELGAGGMATVYLAQDAKHHRQVALKVLRPELATALGPERFLREIETTAQLTHPHILPVHDSGEADGTLFYVMPYVEGESLRDRLNREKQLSLDEALRIGREVADALSHAHAHGVIHRDVKPENILLQGGHAVVADFGIAKAVEQAGHARLTETGLVIGTPAYMSPEQASGDGDVDGRSDIYSLGCVLYEMLTGETPYTGVSAQAILAKKLSEPLPRITVVRDSVPRPIEAALVKALARTPADRFTTAAEFAAVLAHPETTPTTLRDLLRRPPRRRVARRAATITLVAAVVAAVVLGVRAWRGALRGRHEPIPVAILPFENLSPEGPNGRFADALHSQLITQLAGVSALSVRPRASVLGYAETTKPMRTVGEELGVGRVVEGSVQVVGDRLRVNVSLVDARAEVPLWARTYDRALADVFAVQSEIAQRIAEMVGGALTRAEAEALGTAPTESAEAYRLYLLGEEQRIRTCCDPGVFEGAQRLLEGAIELDPGFALAHASLSRVHGWMQVNRWDTRPERVDSQRVEAEAALRLAPRSPQAHLAMGWVYWLAPTATRGDMSKALREFQIAAEEARGSAEAWDYVSWAHSALGDWDGYQAAADRAAALDPRSAVRSANTAATLWMLHRYEEAEAAFNQWLALVAPEDRAGHDSNRALFYVVWQGTLDSLRALVERQGCRVRWLASRLCVQLAFFERKPDSLLALLAGQEGTLYEGYEIYEPTLLWAAWAHELRGDSGVAQRAFRGALAQLDSASQTLPGDPRIHVARGLALAGLGRRADAKAEADWLLAPADSLETDFSQYYRTSAAMILAQARFADAALAELRRLLEGPSTMVSSPMLRIDPRWDPIREDPRFQQLLVKHASPRPVG